MARPAPWLLGALGGVLSLAASWWWLLRPTPEALDLERVLASIEVDAPVARSWMMVDGPDGRQVTGPIPQTVALGSVRKWTTAAVVLMLVDEGVLDLDQPVGDWLAAWSGRDGVTLRRLMSHTAGLPMRPPPGTCSGQGTLSACVDRSAALPSWYPPGERFGYSSLGYQVVARVAEVASGEDWSTLFTERLAGPLAWEGWRFDAAGEGLEAMDGTLWARPEDLLAFARLMDTGKAPDGRRLLSDAALRALDGGQTGGVPRVGPIPHWQWWLAGDDPHGFGAWRAQVVDGRPRFLFAEGRQELLLWADRDQGVEGVMQVVYEGRPPLDQRMATFDVIYAVCAAMEGTERVVEPACLPFVASDAQLEVFRSCLRGKGRRSLCMAGAQRAAPPVPPG